MTTLARNRSFALRANEFWVLKLKSLLTTMAGEHPAEHQADDGGRNQHLNSVNPRCLFATAMSQYAGLLLSFDVDSP